MREYLEQLLLVLSIGSAVAIVAKRISVPYNVALVVVGLVLVLLNVLPGTPMDPGVVLLVFLPILVFQGALSADASSMTAATSRARSRTFLAATTAAAPDTGVERDP